MRKLFIASILILTFCAAIFAQTNRSLLCPTIDVSDSASGILLQDEAMTFAASLSKEADKFDLKYQWTVSSGEITQGQGTLVIKVLLKDFAPTLSVSIEILGLPKECDHTVSSLIKYEPPIQAILLDEMSASRINTDGQIRVFSAIKLQPSAQLFVLVKHKENASEETITRKEQEIFSYLTGEIEKDRISLIRGSAKDALIQFWLVPAGASPPTCDNCISIKLKHSKNSF